jgi:hypothetical protein
MKQICKSKYKQETTAQEYQLLNQQIAFNNLPGQSFENSSVAQSSSLNLVEDINFRQYLFNQFKETAIRGRAEICDLYLISAKTERKEYQKKYEDNIQKMNFNCQSLKDNEKLSLIMVHLVKQRCDNIGERIQCLYKFKAQSVLPSSL